MDTYLVVQCAQYLGQYAKQAECRLLLSLILFADSVIGMVLNLIKYRPVVSLRPSYLPAETRHGARVVAMDGGVLDERIAAGLEEREGKPDDDKDRTLQNENINFTPGVRAVYIICTVFIF